MEYCVFANLLGSSCVFGSHLSYPSSRNTGFFLRLQEKRIGEQCLVSYWCFHFSEALYANKKASIVHICTMYIYTICQRNVLIFMYRMWLNSCLSKSFAVLSSVGAPSCLVNGAEDFIYFFKSKWNMAQNKDK